MKQILIVKPSTISDAQKAQLDKNGIIIIEHINPAEVRLITSMDGFDGNDVFMAAIEAIVDIPASQKVQSKFTEELIKRLKKRNGLAKN